MLASDLAAKLTSASRARREAKLAQVDYSTLHPRPPRKKPVNRPRLTEAEKAAQAAKRLEHRENYAEHLKTARAAVTEQAELMQAEFGKHDLEYYEQEIIQDSRAVKKGRDVNKYNVFLRMKLKELNDGEYISFSHLTCHSHASRVSSSPVRRTQVHLLVARVQGGDQHRMGSHDGNGTTGVRKGRNGGREARARR